MGRIDEKSMNALKKYIAVNKYTLAFGACCGLMGVLVFHQFSHAKQVPTYVVSAKKPGAPTAECRDGVLSYSTSRSGTCSGHGGVLNWR